MAKDQKETKKEEEQKLHIVVVKQMLSLATAGFGLVAALAWNGFIQEVFLYYIKPWIPDFGHVVSLLLYAVIATILAVVITLQLSKLLGKLEKESDDTSSKPRTKDV